MINLRHYQAGARPALVDYIKNNKGKNPLLALPTGSGKSYCIAEVISHFHKRWGTQILVLSHVKEILAQNHQSIEKYSGIETGLNSAGLGKREVEAVTVAGIQSVYRHGRDFQKVKMVIVDEAHLIPDRDESMYRTFFDSLPSDTVIVGFTATPFRLGTGYIYGQDKLFDDLIYDWTSKEKFIQLVDEGYLAPLHPYSTSLEMDTSDVKLKGGDYALDLLSDKFDRKVVTEKAIDEIIKAGSNRDQWLVFAIDIAHAEHIAESLNRRGILTAVVHSKMEEYGFKRDKTIAQIKEGRYKCVVNVDVLTIGFDHPRIDMVCLLRPTKSPVLHVQMLGRGSRISPGKTDCLVLDFADNVERLGPINDVSIIVKGKGKEGGEPIMKTCPQCNFLNYAAARRCSNCGHIFPREHHLKDSPGSAKIIEDGKAHWLKVLDVSYEKVIKHGRPNLFKVTYDCGFKKISEYICVEHTGWAKKKADHWVKYRGGIQTDSVDQLVEMSFQLSIPERIRVQKNGKFFNITESSFRSK